MLATSFLYSIKSQKKTSSSCSGQASAKALLRPQLLPHSGARMRQEGGTALDNDLLYPRLLCIYLQHPTSFLPSLTSERADQRNRYSRRLPGENLVAMRR